MTAPDIDSMPVHPWADRFPMRSAEDLESMAQSIKANGLRMPIVLGKTIIGGKEQLCIVDGRNRREACRIAGIEPQTITLNGEDQDAYIADANLQRRDLTKGQKAMLVAVLNPKQQGKRGTSSVSEQVTKARLSQARSVIEYCPEMVQPVIDGTQGLDDAYAEAQTRKQKTEATETRFDLLRREAPELADLVTEQRMKLGEAEAALRQREEDRANRLRGAVKTINAIDTHVGFLDGVLLDEAISFYRANPDNFTPTTDLNAAVDRWIDILQRLKEGLK